MTTPEAHTARSRRLATAIGATLHRHGYEVSEMVLYSVADTVIRADAAVAYRVQQLAEEYPVGIDTALVLEALDGAGG